MDDHYYNTSEMMQKLGITSRSALKEISKEFTVPELSDEKTMSPYIGKILPYFKDFGRRCKFPKKFVSPYLKEEEKKRNLYKDIDLFNSSNSTLDLLGINALGPLHSGRESIIDFNKRGGKLQILLLNPLSPAFKERQRLEEEFDHLIMGRLTAEFIATMGLCSDIIHFSPFKENITIKTHGTTPKMALVISERDADSAILNCNIYSNEKNERGLMQTHKLNIKKNEKPEQFAQYCNYFIELWKNGKPVDASKMNSLLSQLNSLLIKQEMFDN